MIINQSNAIPGTKESGIEYKIKANYHTHMYLCYHAEGDVVDYVKEAYEKTDIRTLGISDHGPLLYDMMYPYKTEEELVELKIKKNGYAHRRMDMNEFLNVYLPAIEKAQKEYPQMKVLKSLELEYFSGHDEYYKNLAKQCDYLVLGQHFYLDIPNKKLLDYNQVDYTNVIDYANEIAKGLDTKLFNIIAHPDCFLSDYCSEEGIIRKFDNNALKASKIILDACKRNNVAIEYNANGVIRGRFLHYDGTYDYTYPRKEFFLLAKNEYPEVRIVIGLDAHLPMRLHSNHVELCKHNLYCLGIIPDNIEVVNNK